MRSIQAGALAFTALLAATAPSALVAQEAPLQSGEQVTITGAALPPLAQLPAGPEIEGMISARQGNQIQVTAADGTPTLIAVSEETQIRSSGGFLGLGRTKRGSDALLNGLPVSVQTRQFEGGLVAAQVKLADKDLKTAAMIRSGTSQGFAEQTAATEALRGRVGDIDQYNVKGTTNVNFDTGKAVLSAQAKAELCSAASQAGSMENALLLVVGYTDATGPEELNQELSEKRASRVVNHLQQACGWKPYRMLTPTGMAEADPLADNSTEEGKAQNRRVAVNILVSKAVDGL
ncbi:MAG: OmpA family protein [Sphingomonas sp.]|jgi:outer membrane protein OmpA-like peptidoglycan-associated protein|uniref:OmpA family protein n=1 Tax=Sphingomonas sp. TaxID=28214 RepID=UPI0026372C8B|nr:OmpA family protein [Sphingomonas sp.]MDK2766672.1 OmpA family protein [Sphingomonas sp.]